MNMPVRFRINRPQVINQTIDREVIVINLESGCYYSMTGIAAAIWSLIEQGAAVDESAAAIALQYQGSIDEIRVSVDRLAEELLQEGLVVPRNTAAAAEGQAAAANAGDVSKTEKLPMETPFLNKYTDMQELLLLDPIHEVDESGWPVRKEG